MDVHASEGTRELLHHELTVQDLCIFFRRLAATAVARLPGTNSSIVVIAYSCGQQAAYYAYQQHMCIHHTRYSVEYTLWYI